MKILAIADKESRNLWDFYTPGKLDGIDLIISCGDLDSNYLQFLATFTFAPILYVYGNHDTRYKDNPPDGCICIEDDIYVHEGIRILGLGGCLRYNNGDHQFEQREMKKRVRKLWWKLRKHKGFDILVTHAPAYGLGDDKDRCHTGFEVFNDLLEKYVPKYFLHGHVHMSYGRKFKRLKTHGDTLIINPYETYLFEYETEHDDNLAKTKAQEEKEEAQRRKLELEKAERERYELETNNEDL